MQNEKHLNKCDDWARNSISNKKIIIRKICSLIPNFGAQYSIVDYGRRLLKAGDRSLLLDCSKISESVDITLISVLSRNFSTPRTSKFIS